MESGWCSRFGGWFGSVGESEGDILVHELLFVLTGNGGDSVIDGMKQTTVHLPKLYTSSSDSQLER